MEIIVSKYGFVDVYEDDYESGQGAHVNTLDFDVRGRYDSFEQLVSAIDKQIYFNLTASDYEFYDGAIHSSQSVDVNNYVADKNDFELFRNGELDLYIADVYLPLDVGEVRAMNDDDAESFGIGLQ